jgi:hypothetical protein
VLTLRDVCVSESDESAAAYAFCNCIPKVPTITHIITSALMSARTVECDDAENMITFREKLPVLIILTGYYTISLSLKIKCLMGKTLPRS